MDSGNGRRGAGADPGGAEAPCRTLLVEDDEALRQRFASILSAWRSGRLLAACGTLGDAMAVLDREPVDLLITDLRLPDGHGIQGIRRLRALNPQAEAMVVSVLADSAVVIAAIEAGATGYLLKDDDSASLIEAIEELRAGRSPISSSIARVLVRRLGAGGPTAHGRTSALSGAGAAPGAGGKAASARPAGGGKAALEAPEAGGEAASEAPEAGGKVILTPRETEILWGIAKGLTYAEVAEQLGISRQTVPVHIKNIYRKLQVGNRSEAVFEASRLGLIWL